MKTRKKRMRKYNYKKKQKGSSAITYLSQHNKTIKLKKLNCSPKTKGEMNKFTCYTNKSLYKLRDLWNARHPDAKINSNMPKEIHYLLKNH
jgi:hypothetical protein